VLAFSGVLWSISRTLFLVGSRTPPPARSSPCSSAAARGAQLRAIRSRGRLSVGAHRGAGERESIALHRRERQLEIRLDEHLGAVVSNLRRIIAVNRNLGFFTTGYTT
jgi:putative ATP-binding cassette transporter